MTEILIIDDDLRNIFALSATLKQEGFNCITAATASEGMQALSKANSIRIVLLDIMMPGTDGYEMISRIKGDPRFERLPVIAVTAQAMPGDREKCLLAGADEYISKPIDVERMCSIIKSFLN